MDSNNSIFDSKVLGHPSALFVLFFTEMWERFSYYGMRALLVLFLVSSMGLGGWDWPRSNALALYGTYTALVYITPLLGGFLADRYLGYRKAVVIGASIMTLGHVSMALEFNHVFLYLGISFLIIGNGFFKPNMTSMISNMYKNFPEKKDGAYTIFYMGVNSGAFLGILLCGYLGEKVGWSFGFGLAGIFMLLGMLQFHFFRKIFGNIGKKPETNTGEQKTELEFEGDRLNPFTKLDIILVIISVMSGVVWVLNDPISKIAGVNILEINEVDYSNHFILIGLISFFILLFSRVVRYPVITRDRMFAILFFAVMTVIFWMSFEQAGGSMTIFAKDYTNRDMIGTSYYIFLIANILITIVPIGIITWVLFKLFKLTYKKYKLASFILGTCFLIIWSIVFWMLQRDLSSTSYEVSYQAIKTNVSRDAYSLHEDRMDTFKKLITGDKALLSDHGDQIVPDSILYNGKMIIHHHSEKVRKSEREAEQQGFDEDYAKAVLAIDNTLAATVYYSEKQKTKTAVLGDLFFETVVTKETNVHDSEMLIEKSTNVIEPEKLKVGDDLYVMDIDKKGNFRFMSKDKVVNILKKSLENEAPTSLVQAKVTQIIDKKLKIPATWFLILNSLFIITFAPLFSRWWESKYNPSATMKYGFGLILLGVGFGALAFGSTGIEQGAKTASVSMIWLVMAYLFHTLGELCLSPVSLSYVSKLVPGRMIAMMFGIWYIAVAIGNKLAGLLGGKIDEITESYDMATFFLIFTVVPVGLGLIGISLSPFVKKLMHGVK